MHWNGDNAWKFIISCYYFKDLHSPQSKGTQFFSQLSNYKHYQASALQLYTQLSSGHKQYIKKDFELKIWKHFSPETSYIILKSFLLAQNIYFPISFDMLNKLFFYSWF